MSSSLIAPDNHWALLAILFAATFLSIFLEQKFKWAAKLTGAIISLAIAVVLVNLNVIPSEAPVWDDFVWGYAVPLAIPLLLIQTNLRKMHREAGRFLAIFLYRRRRQLLCAGRLLRCRPDPEGFRHRGG